MDVEFEPVFISDPVQVEMPMFYWIELLVWSNTVTSLPDITSCTAMEMINTMLWEKVTTKAFQKAQLAEVAERQEQHPLHRMIQHIKEAHGDDDVV